MAQQLSKSLETQLISDEGSQHIIFKLSAHEFELTKLERSDACMERLSVFTSTFKRTSVAHTVKLSSLDCKSK